MAVGIVGADVHPVAPGPQPALDQHVLPMPLAWAWSSPAMKRVAMPGLGAQPAERLDPVQPASATVERETLLVVAAEVEPGRCARGQRNGRRRRRRGGNVGRHRRRRSPRQHHRRAPAPAPAACTLRLALAEGSPSDDGNIAAADLGDAEPAGGRQPDRHLMATPGICETVSGPSAERHRHRAQRQPGERAGASEANRRRLCPAVRRLHAERHHRVGRPRGAGRRRRARRPTTRSRLPRRPRPGCTRSPMNPLGRFSCSSRNSIDPDGDRAAPRRRAPRLHRYRRSRTAAWSGRGG